MSGVKWLFELTDRVTAPIKNIKDSLSGMKTSLNAQKNGFNQVGHSIDSLKDRLARYEQARNSSMRTDHIRKYNGLIKETARRLKGLQDLPPKSHAQNWTSIAVGMNQAFEIASKIKESLAFSGEVLNLQNNIQRFTQLTGDELDQVTQKTYRLAEVYGEDADSIARAANAMTDQIGGSFEDNLKLIEEGYTRGANLNTDMLDQIKEYGPFMKSAGLDASQGMALMAQAAEKGIYSDKALDAIKEADMSLREMGQAQVDALAGIGLKASDLAGKTSFESMQVISKAMKSADTQARQLVLADIFKGAGEDAGAGFVEGLESIDLNLANRPAVEQAGEWMKSFFADIKFWASDTFGNMSQYVGGLADIGMALMGLQPVIGVIQSLNAAKRASIMLSIKEQALAIKDLALKGAQATWTGIVTVAQWLWNIAMTMNPIGLIVMAIGAVIGIIALLIGDLGGFSSFFTDMWGTLTDWFMSLISIWWDLNPFKWLLDLVDYIFPGTKQAIMDFFTDIFNWIYKNFIEPIIAAWDWMAEALGFGDDKKEVDATVTHKVETEETQSIGSAKPDDKVESKYNSNVLGDTKTKPTKSTTETTKSAGSDKKEIKVNIQNLVGNLNINSQHIAESTAKIREMVNEALVAAVRDFEVAVS